MYLIKLRLGFYQNLLCFRIKMHYNICQMYSLIPFFLEEYKFAGNSEWVKVISTHCEVMRSWTLGTVVGHDNASLLPACPA